MVAGQGRRRTGWAALWLVLAVACAVLAVATWFWFVVPVPFLLAGALAAWLGMSPGRYLDAVDDGSGSAPF